MTFCAVRDRSCVSRVLRCRCQLPSPSASDYSCPVPLLRLRSHDLSSLGGGSSTGRGRVASRVWLLTTEGGRVAEQVWRKSSQSIGGANCLEVACTPDGVRVRDSKVAASPQLIFTPSSWGCLLRNVTGRLI
ncbi:DUF397 domain-containing protein [Streptomyces sp. DSM 40484]|uniref:DUF397 domain-containing protein n=1 Tax=Streptomyces kroppenstedtii TaxID=3051181 RepID=UPI0028D67A82|nr:DUF397 domain-containing protein [Streptomyces sp. DSM 40484]